MNRYYRFGVFLVVFVVLASIAFAEDVRVDREELASIGDQSVKFINYVGPHEFTNTLDQIRDIGRALGLQIDPESSGEAVVGGKYRVLHIVNPDIPEGLDADIFILEPTAAVDHINNLRTIIAGYLETVYGFSPRDAYLVAEFITYYNAVYRGDMEMVRERYKEPVAEALDPAKMGLDTHYSNWAGKTQMLIPLRGGEDRPEIDTGAITDDEVIEEMREEEDRGLDSRRGMVEIIEDEIDEDQKELDQDREELDEREAEVVEKLEELEDKEAAEGGLSAGDEERRGELEEEQAEIESEKEEIQERQSNLDERTEDVMKMRDDIAEDENEMIEEGSGGSEGTFTSAETVAPVLFLTVDAEGDGIPYGRVVKYNLDNGELLAVSEITAVRGRTIALLPDAVLVIAGREGGATSVKPMLLDIGTLEVLDEGFHEVFPGSLMIVKGSDIYLVTLEEGEWRLGKFDAGLSRKAVSEEAVEPWTSVIFDGDSLFVQGESGDILKLSVSDLAEEERLE